MKPDVRKDVGLLPFYTYILWEFLRLDFICYTYTNVVICWRDISRDALHWLRIDFRSLISTLYAEITSMQRIVADWLSFFDFYISSHLDTDSVNVADWLSFFDFYIKVAWWQKMRSVADWLSFFDFYIAIVAICERPLVADWLSFFDFYIFWFNYKWWSSVADWLSFFDFYINF